ncbi:restriction endonuclease subunit S [Pseudomonas sp. NW5]|uniref:restriction endonuclease subunit S n=1 Tax=Pseudomonas sp. NW5 TaxID=2934934 RepID=UPI00201FD94C|nr:restriction endonuclease subunit S [Pseudomonas sp. NW5]MCL7463379.1 restriction endonuclease subunit S [Pseudomonas sp. NW5]
MTDEIKPGYKQTEVGVIPEEWDVRSVFEISDRQKSLFDDGDWIEAEYITKAGIRLVQTGNIGVGEFIDKDSKKYISEESFKVLGCKEIKAGDILICRLAEPAGRACIFPETADKKSITSVDVTIFRPKYGFADRGYLNQYLSSRQWFSSVSVSVGGTTHKRISRSALGEIPVPFPRVEEQIAIASSLMDIDSMVIILEQLIAKKRDIKQAVMQQLLSGQKRLPGFSGEWEVKQFGSTLKRINAKAHQIQTSAYQTTGKYPVVDQGKESVIGFSDDEDKIYRNSDEGVIVFGDHTCIVKFVDFDFLVGADGTQVIQGMKGQSTRFHAFQLQYRGIEQSGYNRHFKILKEHVFQVPPLDEQNAIAAIFSDIDAELAALEARRDKARQLKQGMMQELLTGRIRLK